MASSPDKTRADTGQARLLHTLERLLAVEATDFRGALDQAAQLVADALAAEKVDAFILDPTVETLVAIGVSDTPLGRRQQALGAGPPPSRQRRPGGRCLSDRARVSNRARGPGPVRAARHR